MTISFLIYFLFFQVLVTIVGLNVIKEKEISCSELLKSWLFGRLLGYGILQILSVPMILLRVKFDVLFWTFISICLLLLGLGGSTIKGRRWKCADGNAYNWLTIILLISTFVLILWQSGNYFFGMHLDEDDARWIVEANDALATGDMMTRSYDTGEYIGKYLMPEDVTSPWPMMYALMARILNTSTSIFTHSIYSPIAVFMMYSIYWLIGTELLKRTEARVAFVFFVVLFNTFYGGTVYTQGTFSLVRIWQGKASVAALIIPTLFFLFINLNKYNRASDWIMIIFVAAAACLMSGMGIIIAALMIGVYGAYNILIYQHWKRIPLWLCALAPSLISFLIYYGIKG